MKQIKLEAFKLKTSQGQIVVRTTGLLKLTWMDKNIVATRSCLSCKVVSAFAVCVLGVPNRSLMNPIFLG